MHADDIADEVRGHLAVELVVHVLLGRLDDLHHLLVADRAFVARPAQTLDDLFPLVRLAGTVFLDHRQPDRLFGPLVRGVAALASDALATPTNDPASLGASGVDYFIVVLPAKRTLHEAPSMAHI